MKPALALTLLLATSSQAFGQTLYVNGACGDDAWSGLSQSCVAPDGPKRTIQAAVSASGADARIVVVPGLYLENVSVNRPFIWSLVIESQEGAAGQETVIDSQGIGSALGATGPFGSSLRVRGITFQN